MKNSKRNYLLPEFDKVDPAPAVADLSKATIALVTTGGLVPKGNPDHLQSASAQKWVKYDVSKLDRLGDDYYTVHGGFDPVYCNEFPDRVAPLDQLRQFEKDGYIGKVFDFFYSTTGTGTAVSNSEQFGREMGQELKTAGIDAVILTSTYLRNLYTLRCNDCKRNRTFWYTYYPFGYNHDNLSICWGKPNSSNCCDPLPSRKSGIRRRKRKSITSYIS